MNGARFTPSSTAGFPAVVLRPHSSAETASRRFGAAVGAPNRRAQIWTRYEITVARMILRCLDPLPVLLVCERTAEWSDDHAGTGAYFGEVAWGRDVVVVAFDVGIKVEVTHDVADVR